MVIELTKKRSGDRPWWDEVDWLVAKGYKSSGPEGSKSRPQFVSQRECSRSSLACDGEATVQLHPVRFANGRAP